MGYQLWTSPVTGYRRRGTRLSEFRALLEGAVTAHAILEPLQSCPVDADAVSMREILRQRDFDVAGVMEKSDGPVVGWVVAADLSAGKVKDHLRHMSEDMTIPASSSVTTVLAALAKGSTPLTRTLRRSLIMGQEECHATATKVQRRVQA